MGGCGARKQFLILNNKIIPAWVANGQKFKDCTIMTDITTRVQLKEVKDMASIKLESTESALNGTIPPIITTLSSKGGGETFTQKNAFDETAGVLELMVPTHKCKDKKETIFHP